MHSGQFDGETGVAWACKQPEQAEKSEYIGPVAEVFPSALRSRQWLGRSAFSLVVNAHLVASLAQRLSSRPTASRAEGHSEGHTAESTLATR